jgi:hypothetical protein
MSRQCHRTGEPTWSFHAHLCWSFEIAALLPSHHHHCRQVFEIDTLNCDVCLGCKHGLCVGCAFPDDPHLAKRPPDIRVTISQRNVGIPDSTNNPDRVLVCSFERKVDNRVRRDFGDWWPRDLRVQHFRVEIPNIKIFGADRRRTHPEPQQYRPAKCEDQGLEGSEERKRDFIDDDPASPSARLPPALAGRPTSCVAQQSTQLCTGPQAASRLPGGQPAEYSRNCSR